MSESEVNRTESTSTRDHVEESSRSLLDEYGIERDPRFKQARKEAKVVFGYMASTVVFFVGITFWGATSFDGSYTYILGMPPYFLAAIVGACVFIAVGMFIGLRYIEDDSMEAWI